jgi:very-short-patch-repair endonuclease/ABC-type Zn uptake system ZnuABC Zn-binding protein ZnuA
MDQLYNNNGNIKKNSWKNTENHVLYARYLGNELRFTEPEDWYKISHKDIKKNKGAGLLAQYYNDSPILFVKEVVKLIYPDYEWFEWKFNKTTNKFWDKIENQKIYMDWLFNELKFTKIEDFYNINIDIIRQNFGDSLLHKYNGSHINTLKVIYPEYYWLEWKFNNVSLGTWEDNKNHKRYAEWLGNKLGFTNEKDWYKITQDIINDNNGSSLLENYYNSSPILFVRSVFPDYKWLEWKFRAVPNGFWNDINNHKIYAEWLGNELGFTEPEHWYDITRNSIHNNHGGGLLALYYNGSPIVFVKKLVKLVYPEYEWLEWKFGVVPNNFWQDINNHKRYAEWLGNELRFTEPEHWYKITQNSINNNHGCGLLGHYYDSSPILFVKIIYPHYEWLEWKFGMVSHGFWQDINNHKRYAEWLGNELGFTEPEHWYKITQNSINNNHGCGLLGIYYNGSPILFLRGVFPEYEWLETKFISKSNGFWQDINNHKIYAEWLGNELGFTEPEHWYKITTNSIRNNHGGGLLGGYYNGSPILFLRGVFPDYNWDEIKFYKNKTERILYEKLIYLFPTIIYQFKQEWCMNIHCLPFDFCIPEYKIIIELDGRQHFEQVANWRTPEEQFKIDKYKEQCANDNNYSVIRILQEDVLNDTYDWVKELCDAIEKIKNRDEIKNEYLCKNNEYYKYRE